MLSSLIIISILFVHTLPIALAEEVHTNSADLNDSDRYFKVDDERVSVYDNSSGKLVEIGKLEKGSIFKHDRVLGNWVEVTLGTKKGYVWRYAVSPYNGSDPINLSSNSQSSYTVKTTSNIPVYDNGNGSLTKIAELQEGIAYSIIQEVGNWAKISFAGKIAYIHNTGYGLSFDSSITSFITEEDKVPVVVNEDGSLNEVGYLEKGQVYKRIRDLGNWHEIQFGDHIGYVWKSATKPSVNPSGNQLNNPPSTIKLKILEDVPVYDNSSGKLVKMATLKKSIEYPVVSQMGNWYKVSFSGREGYIYHTGGELLFTSTNKFFKPRSKNLEVVKSVNGKLVPFAILSENQSYQRLRDLGNWHEISVAGEIGYVWKDATVPVFGSNPSKPNSNHPYLFKTRQHVAVYDNSSGSLVQFADLLPNTTYQAITQEGNWLKLQFAGRVGYVHNSGIDIVMNSNIHYFKVIQDQVNIVKTVNGVSKDIGELVRGQHYKRIGDSGNWHKVMFGNQVGYVWKGATEPSIVKSYKNDHNTKQSKVGTLKVTKNALVYDNTSGKLVSFIRLNAGEEFPYFEKMGNWYKIEISGRDGYIYKDAVEVKQTYKNIVNPYQTYSYKQMVKDINSLKAVYPDLIQTKVIGKSVDGRDIWAVKLGKGNVEIFFNGSHHAREYITTNLIMEQIDSYTQSYVKNSKIRGYSTRTLLNQTSIWYVPMVNPDGVTLVQEGYKSARNPQLVLMLNGNSKNFSAWKANIRGVDLNRQYPANWEHIKSNPGKPGSTHYKGPRPLSEPEVMALYNFTNQHNFKTAVAYHTSGEILYWNFKQDSTRYNRDLAIAKMISAKTSYNLVYPGPNPSGGGYTDWFISRHKKPSFTPEVSPYVGNRPVPIGNFTRIWNQNDSLGLMLANEAYQNRNKR